jgi:hypothetical protein
VLSVDRSPGIKSAAEIASSAPQKARCKAKRRMSMRSYAVPVEQLSVLGVVAAGWFLFSMFDAPTSSAGIDEGRLATSVLVGLSALAQILFGLLLWLSIPRAASEPGRVKLRRRLWRCLVGWYYFVAILVAPLAGSMARAYEIPVLGGLTVFGAVTLAATAQSCMRCWDTRRSARTEIAAFLLGTHVLGALVLIGLAVQVGREDREPLAQNVAWGGLLSLTLLALPVCAGMWVRLRMAPANGQLEALLLRELQRERRTHFSVAEVRKFACIFVLGFALFLMTASTHGGAEPSLHGANIFVEP